MNRKDRRAIIKTLTDNYDIIRYCPVCKVSPCKMIANPDRANYLLCPQCGRSEPILAPKGKATLIDVDEGKPILVMVEDRKESSLEDQEIEELKKQGMNVKYVRRL